MKAVVSTIQRTAKGQVRDVVTWSFTAPEVSFTMMTTSTGRASASDRSTRSTSVCPPTRTSGFSVCVTCLSRSPRPAAMTPARPDRPLRSDPHATIRAWRSSAVGQIGQSAQRHVGQRAIGTVAGCRTLEPRRLHADRLGRPHIAIERVAHHHDRRRRQTETSRRVNGRSRDPACTGRLAASRRQSKEKARTRDRRRADRHCRSRSRRRRAAGRAPSGRQAAARSRARCRERASRSGRPVRGAGGSRRSDRCSSCQPTWRSTMPSRSAAAIVSSTAARRSASSKAARSVSRGTSTPASAYSRSKRSSQWRPSPSSVPPMSNRIARSMRLRPAYHSPARNRRSARACQSHNATSATFIGTSMNVTNHSR